MLRHHSRASSQTATVRKPICKYPDSDYQICYRVRGSVHEPFLRFNVGWDKWNETSCRSPIPSCLNHEYTRPLAVTFLRDYILLAVTSAKRFTYSMYLMMDDDEEDEEEPGA